MAKGGRRRTLAQIDKDARALALYCQGMTYREIAIDGGWRHPGSAMAAVKRALAERQRDAFAQVEDFAAAIARIQKGIRECQSIIDTPHYLASPGGKLVTGPDGELVLDDGPKQRAITEQRHLNDQLMTLQDLRPAAKSRVEVVTQDVVDKQIQDELEQIRKLADAGEAPGPGVIREP